MKNISLYNKWLLARLSELNTSQNLRWLMFYVIFSITGFFGLHLLFLKKFKRFIWYLIPWAILIGSYALTFSRPIPFMIFFIGLVFLAIVFLIDVFKVYFVQTSRMDVYLPFILLLLLFCAQVFLYELLAHQYAAFINEKVLSIAGRFSGIN